jgi:putative nucleotidyltransferase with HDIG domain
MSEIIGMRIIGNRTSSGRCRPKSSSSCCCARPGAFSIRPPDRDQSPLHQGHGPGRAPQPRLLRPRARRKLSRRLQSTQCNLSTIGDAIQKDPDLTARLLRLANSPFFGFANRLSTVAEAVSLLGIQQIQDMIVASSVLEQFKGVPDHFVNKDSFWRHSLAVGITARLLAMERRLPKPDKFFVAGLLHDVGRLVLLSQAAESAQAVFELYQRETHAACARLEKKVLGYDHQQIAAELLQSWSYPPVLVQAVAFHHTPSRKACARARGRRRPRRRPSRQRHGHRLVGRTICPAA